MKETDVIRFCKKHGETPFFKRKDRGGSYRCRKCSGDAVTRRRHALILKAIEYAGGRCKVCGYNKCNGALEFHHRDPTEKEFRISDGQTRSWDRIKAEVGKCDLLCANCHRELHHECIGP